MILARWSARRTMYLVAALVSVAFVSVAPALAQEGVCVGGPNDGEPCAFNEDCDPGYCDFGSEYELTWHAIDAGGVISGGDYQMACVIGQTVAGKTSGGDYSLSVGYMISPALLYYTGFEPEEGFGLGPIDSQEEWSADTQASVADDNPAAGVQHLQLIYDAGGVPWPKAYSPNWGPLETMATTTSVDVSISQTGGSYYFVFGENPSQGGAVHTWEVTFDASGQIMVADGGIVVDTGATWTPGVYKNLTICDDPGAGEAQYYYDGAFIYKQQTHMEGTAVEQVRVMSTLGPGHADFDNLFVRAGLCPLCRYCPSSSPPEPPPGEAGYEKIRYISMVPGNPGRQTALRVHLKSLPPPFDVSFNSTKCWVGEPQQVSENSGKINHQPGWPDFMSANLQGSPHCMDWSTVGTLHVTDDDIIPSAVYEVQAIGCECDFDDEANYSAPLTITTSKWGDLVGTCAVIPCTPPEGVVNITTDVTACLDKFRNLEGAVLKSRADVEPNFPDWLVNISDVTYVLDAFRGFAYPAAQTPPAPGWPGPDGCP